MLQINLPLICLVLRFLINHAFKTPYNQCTSTNNIGNAMPKNTVSIVRAWSTNIKRNGFKNSSTKRRSQRSYKELIVKNLYI